MLCLVTPVVVVVDVRLDCRFEFLIGAELAQVVHLAFQSAPKAFHGCVIEASSYPGHTLGAACFVQHLSESLGSVLEPTVAMEQRTCVWVLLHRQVKGLEDQIIVVSVSKDEGDDTVIPKVKDRAEVCLLVDAILELSDIGEPFLVRHIGVKVTAQDILRGDFRRARDIGPLLGSDDRLEAHAPHQTAYSFGIVGALVVPVDVHGHPAVTEGLFMGQVVLKNLRAQPILFRRALRFRSLKPLVVAGSGYACDRAKKGHRMPLARHSILDGHVGYFFRLVPDSRRIRTTSSFF